MGISDSEKAGALAEFLEVQFQPMTIPYVPEVIEMVDVALRSYFMTRVTEHEVTNPVEIHEAIRSFKVGETSDTNGIPNRALKHLPQRAVSLLAQIFKAVVVNHHFPTMWKHDRVISIVKTRKDPVLPASYRSISLLETIVKLFENVLLTRLL